MLHCSICIAQFCIAQLALLNVQITMRIAKFALLNLQNSMCIAYLALLHLHCFHCSQLLGEPIAGDWWGNLAPQSPKIILWYFEEVAVAGGTGGPGFLLRVYNTLSENPSKQA